MIYKVKNLNKFAISLGKIAAKNSGFTHEELKSYIKISNIKNMILQYGNRLDDGSITIDEEATNIIYAEIFDWLVGVDLATLAANDIIDCYWDNEKNDMIFMRKDGNRNENDMA